MFDLIKFLFTTDILCLYVEYNVLCGNKVLLNWIEFELNWEIFLHLLFPRRVGDSVSVPGWHNCTLASPYTAWLILFCITFAWKLMEPNNITLHCSTVRHEQNHRCLANDIFQNIFSCIEMVIQKSRKCVHKDPFIRQLALVRCQTITRSN